MFEHDRLAEEQLFVKEKDPDGSPRAGAEQAQKPEKMQRLRRVIEQELDADQVEQDSNGAGKAVMRLALLTQRILDRNFRNRCPRPACQGRNEPVQLAIELDVLDHFPSISLKGGAKIVKVDSRKLAHHPVRDAAGQLPSQPGILSFHAPAADDVVAFRHGDQKLRDILRVVLQVPIHGDNDVALRKVKSGLQGCGLAEVSPQPND